MTHEQPLPTQAFWADGPGSKCCEMMSLPPTYSGAIAPGRVKAGKYVSLHD